MQIRGREINVRFWLLIICIIIILMLLPLSYIDYREISYTSFEYRSIVFTYSINTFLVDPELSFANPTRLFAAISICIPAVYMNHKLAKSSWKHLDPKFSLSIFLGTIVLSEYFSNEFPPWELRWLFDMGYYWSYTWDMDRFGLMIITFLIIVPLLIRETKIMGDFRKSPAEMIDDVNTNQKSILESSKKRLAGRYMILGITLGLIAVIIPIQFYISEIGSLPAPNNSFQFDVDSFFFQFSINNEPIPYNMFVIIFEIVSPLDMLNHLPYAGFQLIFVYGFLQYLRGNLSKRRIRILGVLSLGFPFAYRASANIIYNVEGEYIIPLPVVLLIGLLVLRIAKPVDSTLYSQKKSILEMPLNSIPLIQRDTIHIPFLYVVKSKFSSLMKRITGNTKSTKTSDRN